MFTVVDVTKPFKEIGVIRAYSHPRERENMQDCVFRLNCALGVQRTLRLCGEMRNCKKDNLKWVFKSWG